jgi:hypothetical protein
MTTDDTQVIWTVQEGDAGGRVVTRGAKAEGGTLSSRGMCCNFSGLLAGDVKESRNGNPTRDLQMAAN